MNPIAPLTLTSATADLSSRAIFKLTGPDAKLYLNGQVSQDVRLASIEKAVYSVISNFKGKLEGDCFIREHEGDILIDTCESQRESLFMRLDRYLIADDAELIDVSDDYSLYFVTGISAHPFPRWENERYGVKGTDYLLPSSESIENATSSAEWEQVRISNKTPQWGAELNDSVLPAEANIEDRAISYTKGCYTGQEVISRMKSSGKTNRHIVGFLCDKELSTPLDLFVNLDDKKPGATLTSICEIDGEWIGLGYRTRKAEGSDSFVSSEGSVRVI